MEPAGTSDPADGPRPAQDYYRLRREGIGHIERTGSAAWTDYNTHDPGISILEALAYTITELAHRTALPIEDILASAPVSAGASAADPYPDQAFHSARRILTVNPTTVGDLRRLLIDVDPVRNAWVRCDPCDGAPYSGLYGVLLELEADPVLGDLNDRKIVRQRMVEAEDGRHPWTVEVLFPAWPLARRDELRRLAEGGGAATVTVAGPHRTTTGTTPVDDAELRRHWSDAFRVDYLVELADHTTITIEDATVRLFGDPTVRGRAVVADLNAWLGDNTDEGFLEAYRRKLSATEAAVDTARAVLESHRNLDEDFWSVGLVEIAEVAVCADVEVEPTADIDRVQAEVWHRIERYLDPPVAFRSLDDLLGAGTPVEEIFDGPGLDHGFLTEEGLAETGLRSELRGSDILNLLSDIDGVVSLRGLVLTAYDAGGNVLEGASDPDWSSGTAVFDPQRTGASWLLVLPADHRPRLHHALSRFLFSSRGMPTRPRLDDAEDTLVQLHGGQARPKPRGAALDLPTPLGRPRRLDSYMPVQHGFPLVYGIGPAGLPSTATARRRAQAKQLKAYLMVFEQLLRNGYAQLAHAADLFSLDPGIEHTYFTGTLDDAGITDYGEIVAPALTPETLAGIAETRTEFLDRRNRFLDQLLARFGESFADYGMLGTDLAGRGKPPEDLVREKLAFLRALPRIGHDRGKAFDASNAPCAPGNAPGLRRRVNLLLGLPDWTLAYRAQSGAGGAGSSHAFRLEERGEPMAVFTPPDAVSAALDALVAEVGLDPSASPWRLESTDGLLLLTRTADGRERTTLLSTGDSGGAARALGRELAAAQRSILAELVRRRGIGVAASGDLWRVTVEDGTGAPVGAGEQRFPTRRTAEEFIGRMVTWAAHHRAIVVEHLLLRPKFPGDARYPGCEDDPYSFRLTYVMPGWTAPFSTDMAMRRFADRTIQEQTPSHLLGKTCWVGNDGYVPDPCDPVVDRVAAALEAGGIAHDAACACAAEICAVHAAVFGAWFASHALGDGPPEAIAASLAAMFAADADLADAACGAEIDAALRATVQGVLVGHFAGIARHGFQFERFEKAWCAWAEADAEHDWSRERLLDTVLEMLGSAPIVPAVSHAALCACATGILTAFGASFREWMDANTAAGTRPEAFPPFDPPALEPCAGINVAPPILAAVRALLLERYGGYTEVSYRLHRLVRALAELRNTYPRATLHDCGDGSGINPVRLGQTALGSN